jgi:hypothetical protein
MNREMRLTSASGTTSPAATSGTGDTMNDQDHLPMDVEDSPPVATAALLPRGTGKRLRDNTKAVVVGSLLVGGVAGAAILGPLAAAAASPTPSAITTPATPATPEASPDADTEQPDGRGGGGHTEAISDTSVVAKAIGISEADLKTALAGGQTVADVAKAHNVAVQSVIDALVADGTSELAAQVANGSITQAQADAEKAEILQRATAQANGTFGGRP